MTTAAPVRGEAQLRAAAGRLAQSARTLLGPGGAPAAAGDAPREVAAHAAATAGRARAAIAACAADDEALPALTRLAAEALDLAEEARAVLRARRAQIHADVEQGLARLREVRSSAELLDRVCGEVMRSCGFRRVMLSRLEARAGDREEGRASDLGDWVPWIIDFGDSGRWAELEEIMAATRIPLDLLEVESGVLADHRPAMLTHITPDATPLSSLLAASESTSYVVAPITPAGRVVGFLHADHWPEERPVDRVDRDALWAFAEGFGRIYERTVLLERLRATRHSVRHAFEVAEDVMATLDSADIELLRHAEERLSEPTETVRRNAAIDALLTVREREVLELMAKGFGNAAIAERLVISEGTVKSHVKHVLRKLGALNRADAIARYLGAGEPRT